MASQHKGKLGIEAMVAIALAFLFAAAVLLVWTQNLPTEPLKLASPKP